MIVGHLHFSDAKQTKYCIVKSINGISIISVGSMLNKV